MHTGNPLTRAVTPCGGPAQCTGAWTWQGPNKWARAWGQGASIAAVWAPVGSTGQWLAGGCVVSMSAQSGSRALTAGIRALGL